MLLWQVSAVVAFAQIRVRILIALMPIVVVVIMVIWPNMRETFLTTMMVSFIVSMSTVFTVLVSPSAVFSTIFIRVTLICNSIFISAIDGWVPAVAVMFVGLPVSMLFTLGWAFLVWASRWCICICIRIFTLFRRAIWVLLQWKLRSIHLTATILYRLMPTPFLAATSRLPATMISTSSVMAPLGRSMRALFTVKRVHFLTVRMLFITLLFKFALVSQHGIRYMSIMPPLTPLILSYFRPPHFRRFRDDLRLFDRKSACLAQIMLPLLLVRYIHVIELIGRQIQPTDIVISQRLPMHLLLSQPISHKPTSTRVHAHILPL